MLLCVAEVHRAPLRVILKDDGQELGIGSIGIEHAAGARGSPLGGRLDDLLRILEGWIRATRGDDVKSEP